MITEEVIETIKRDAWRYTRFGIDREEAEAISMVGLCKAAQSFDESLGVPFIAYARTTIKYHQLDELRVRTKRGKRPMYQNTRPLYDTDLTVAIDEERYLMMRRIWALVATLSKGDQKILKLRYLKDMEPKEIAEKLRLKHNSVHVMLWMATRNLKKVIQQEQLSSLQHTRDKDALRKCLAKWA